MSIVTSLKRMKLLDFAKSQKSRYLENKASFFLKKNHELQIKGHFMAKNTFVAEVTFKFRFE